MYFMNGILQIGAFLTLCARDFTMRSWLLWWKFCVEPTMGNQQKFFNLLSLNVFGQQLMLLQENWGNYTALIKAAKSFWITAFCV